MVEANRSFLEAGGTMNIVSTASPFPLQIDDAPLRRSLTPETKGFLWQYGVSTGQEDFETPFEDELLIREGAQDYWLPFPAGEVEHLLLPPAPGQELTLHVRLIGSLETEQGLRTIFVVTDIEP